MRARIINGAAALRREGRRKLGLCWLSLDVPPAAVICCECRWGHLTQDAVFVDTSCRRM